MALGIYFINHELTILCMSQFGFPRNFRAKLFSREKIRSSFKIVMHYDQFEYLCSLKF